MSDTRLAPDLEEPGGLDEISVVTAEAFAAVDEPGIESILGTVDDNLIAIGSDCMIYGDGGAGKTTLTVDLACHLATGTEWLGIDVSQPRTVLLVENEGPRPLFRRKLRRKIAVWPWEPPGDRILVWEAPWADFSFTEAEARAQLARIIFEHAVDVVIAGPLTQLGMDDAGTLQDVRRFHALITEVRDRSLRPAAFVVIHHESKAGRVSGAWEGVGDTLLQLQATGHHAARIYVQKARWSAAHHGKTIRLVWSEGDSYAVEDAPTPETKATETWDRILDYVKAHGGTKWTKLADELGVNHDYGRRRRDAMIDAGVLVDVGTGEGRGHTYVLWWVDDPARPLLIDELAGGPQESSSESSGPSLTESSEVRTTPGTTTHDPMMTRLTNESSGRPPSKADDSFGTTSSTDPQDADGVGPNEW